MQVVTPENYQQFIETGKVPEFKPPEEAKSEAKPAEQPRGEDGKFIEKPVDNEAEKADKGDTGTATAETEIKADDPPVKVEEEESDDDLPEKVRKKIGAKHRAMKEAEEFAEREFNKRKAAERRAVELEERISRLEKSGHAPEGKPESKDDGMPKQEDFKTVGEYADAVIEYKLEKRDRERQEKAAKSAQETEQARIEREFATRQEAVKKEFPDYAEVLERSEINLPKAAMQYVVESELGPRLAYHLAKNPQEADRIAQLSPIRAIAELGKLEDRLTKPAKQEAKVEAPVVSKAPSPIKPLGGDGAVPVHKDPADMTFQELRAYERQKEADRRARR